jgi:hypothetical protein
MHASSNHCTSSRFLTHCVRLLASDPRPSFAFLLKLWTPINMWYMHACFQPPHIISITDTLRALAPDRVPSFAFLLELWTPINRESLDMEAMGLHKVSCKGPS